MIDVKPLKDWIKKHTINRSKVFPQGWVNTEELIRFLQENDRLVNVDEDQK